MNLTVHQTLADFNNPDHVEEYGPFPCDKPNAWLGYGYYFWDTHIELAHWWGEVAYSKQYMICKAKATLDETCWDLHGNGNHRLEFESICVEIVKSGLSTKEKLLVPQVIEFFKRKGSFLYSAIRALGMHSISSRFTDDYVIFRMNFVKHNPAYLDVHPAVQLCLLNKNSLSLRKYKVIYPAEYSEFYA